MDKSDNPPRIRPLVFLFPLLLVKLGLALRGVAFALRPKVRVGLLVFVSPRFLSLCLASTFCRKLLLANQKGLVFAVVLPFRSLICSSPPPPPLTVAFSFLTLNVKARNISKVLRSANVVVLIMNVLCRALSFLPLLVI